MKFVDILVLSLICSGSCARINKHQQLTDDHDALQTEASVLDGLQTSSSADRVQEAAALVMSLDGLYPPTGAGNFSTFVEKVAELSKQAATQLEAMRWMGTRMAEMTTASYRAQVGTGSSATLMIKGMSVVWENSSPSQQALAAIGGLAATYILLDGLYHILPKLANLVVGDSASSLVNFSVKLALPIGTLDLDLRVHPKATANDILAAVKASAPFVPAGLQFFKLQRASPTPLRTSFSTAPRFKVGVAALQNFDRAIPLDGTKSIATEGSDSDVIVAYSDSVCGAVSGQVAKTKALDVLAQLRTAGKGRARILNALLPVVEMQVEMLSIDSFIITLTANVVAMTDPDSHVTPSTKDAACWAHVPNSQLLASFGGAADLNASSDGSATKAAVGLAALAVERRWDSFVRSLVSASKELEGHLATDGALDPSAAARIRGHVNELRRLLPKDDQSTKRYSGLALQGYYKEVAFVTEQLVRAVVAAFEHVDHKDID